MELSQRTSSGTGKENWAKFENTFLLSFPRSTRMSMSVPKQKAPKFEQASRIDPVP